MYLFVHLHFTCFSVTESAPVLMSNIMSGNILTFFFKYILNILLTNFFCVPIYINDRNHYTWREHCILVNVDFQSIHALCNKDILH